MSDKETLDHQGPTAGAAPPAEWDEDDAFEERLKGVLYEGYIDAIESGRVYGWALDPADKTRRISVTVYHGDRELDVVIADRFREDLRDYGDGSGKHAFVVDLEKDLWNRSPAEFHAYFTGTNVPLLRGQRVTEPFDPVAEPGEAAVGADGIEVADIDFKHLVGRIEQLERALVGVMRVIQPSGARMTEVSRSVKASERHWTETRRDMEALEGFVVRIDQTLREAAAIEPAAGPPRQSMRGQIIALFCLLVVTGAVILFWTLGQPGGW